MGAARFFSVDTDPTRSLAWAGAGIAIATANQQLVTAFRQQDARAIAGLYGERAQILPASSPPLQGRRAIQSFWQAILDLRFTEIRLQTAELEAEGQFAHEVGSYALVGPSNGSQPACSGRYLAIWRQTGDQWQIHRTLWNSRFAL
jgi:ketosteroid isomerase-like protein